MSKRAPKKPRPAAVPKAATSKASVDPAEPPTAESAKAGMSRRLSLGLRIVEPLSVAGLLVFMLWKSWLRWPDPLIDFPRDLYVAWRVSAGDNLYEKIASWYGPLSHLAQGAGFKLFGVGLDTMVWMNIALTVAALLLLRGIFGRIGHRGLVWLVSVVFIVAFACEQLTNISNYNFITPYVSQATYTFAGLLVVLWAVLRHLRSERRRWLVVAGLGLAVAYLDKPEGALAAAGVLSFYLLARGIRRARQHGAAADWRGAGGWALRSLGWLVAGFFALWLPVFLYFFSKGSFGYALLATNFMPYTVAHAVVSGTVAHSPQMQSFSGFDHPWRNFFAELLAGGWLLVVCGLMTLAGWGLARARQYHGAWWSWLAVLVGAGGSGVWLGFQDNAWVGVGDALAFPVFLATLAVVAWSLHSAWRGREDFAHALGVAVVGVAGSLMLSRIILAARVGQYGFFMMPLAAMFWIQVMMMEAPRLAARGRKGPATWLLPTVFTLLVLGGTGQLLRVDLEVYGDKTLEVGAGRDRFYAFPLVPKPGRLGNTRGSLLKTMIEDFQTHTPNARTLDNFPEGIAVNYHLRVPTTLAELEFDPFALSFFGQAHVLDELAAHPPDAIFVHYRDLREFGANYFGESAASGSAILEWVQKEYRLINKAGAAPTKTGDAMDLYVPKLPPGARAPAENGSPPPNAPPPERGPPLYFGPL